MLLASFSNFMGQPVIIVAFELIGAGIVGFGLFSYLRNVNVRSQLTAKDAVIATNQQTISSFGERLDSLDAKVKALEEENAYLKTELTNWEDKYRSLENFAAPRLAEKLISMFEHQEDLLSKMVCALEGIQSKIDSFDEQKSE
jgi:predicted RNase H-like nuclease (RuvC/YqgF family)